MARSEQARALARRVEGRTVLAVALWTLLCLLVAWGSRDLVSTLGEAIAANDSAWATYTVEDYDVLLETGRFADPRKTYQVVGGYDEATGADVVRVRDITLYTQLHDLKVPAAIAVYLGGLVVVFLWAQRRYLDAFDDLAAAVTDLVRDPAVPVRLPEELSVAGCELESVRRERLEADAAARAADEAALAAERRKDELVTYLAHDLRTPLTSVTGYLELLDESPDLPGDARRRYVAVARDRAVRLGGLVEELFEISRFNLQTIPLERRQVDLVLLGEQVAEEAMPDAAGHGLSVRVEADGPCVAAVDPGRAARMLSNLVRNAVAHGEEGTEVVVGVGRAPDGGVRLSVRDDGPDIPEELLPHVFERFVRGDDARGAGAGAGLGLSIVEEIARAHGGRAWAESADGTTTFTVELPR